MLHQRSGCSSRRPRRTHAPRPLTCRRYAKHDDRSAAHSRVGTSTYIAPEVLHNAAGQYNAKQADVWCCGVVLYNM